MTSKPFGKYFIPYGLGKCSSGLFLVSYMYKVSNLYSDRMPFIGSCCLYSVRSISTTFWHFMPIASCALLIHDWSAFFPLKTYLFFSTYSLIPNLCIQVYTLAKAEKFQRNQIILVSVDVKKAGALFSVRWFSFLLDWNKSFFGRTIKEKDIMFNYCWYFNGLVLTLRMDLIVFSEETDDLTEQSVVEARPKAVESSETVVAAEEASHVPTVTASKPKYRYDYNCLPLTFVWHMDRRSTFYCVYIHISSVLLKLL